MTEKNLQILRTLDKADRMEPEDIFDLLTNGRKDKSGAFTEGCDIPNSQAVFLTSFVFSQKMPIFNQRLQLISRMEDTIIDPITGKTQWDQFLEIYKDLPEPKNIAHALDIILNKM